MLYMFKLNIFLQKKDLFSLFSNLDQFLKIIEFLLYLHQLYLQIHHHHHLLILKLNVKQILFVFCNLTRSFHLLTLFLQTVSVVNQEECLLNLEFFILNYLLNHLDYNLMLLFFQLSSLQKFTCLKNTVMLMIFHIKFKLTIKSFIFQFCNLTRSFYLLTIFLQKLTIEYQQE